MRVKHSMIGLLEFQVIMVYNVFSKKKIFLIIAAVSNFSSLASESKLPTICVPILFHKYTGNFILKVNGR